MSTATSARTIDLTVDRTLEVVPPVVARRDGLAARLASRAKPLLVLGDGAAAAVGALGATAAAGPAPLHGAQLALACGLGFAIVGGATRLYRSRFTAMRIDEFRRVAGVAWWLAVAALVAAWSVNNTIDRTWLISALAAVTAAVLLEREVARLLFAAARRKELLLKRVVILGTNDEARALERLIKADPTTGYRVMRTVEHDSPTSAEQRRRVVDGALEAVRAAGANTVLVASTAVDAESSNSLIRRLTDEGVHVELTSTLRDINFHRLTVRPIGRFPVMYIEPIERGGWRAAAKRTFDLALSVPALLILSPLMALVAVAIKLDSKGPVFFGQTRVGRDGEPFRVWKFRTMVDGAERLVSDLRALNDADGPLFKIQHDPRITRLGRLLRKTSMDELPQLWNVVCNQMSLVGPRPALPEEQEEWDPDLHERLLVQPGITGMWQVSGRSDSSFEEYARLDLYYVHNWSLGVDLAILARTLPTVLRSRGAY